MSITAHGATYRTAAEANARIAELNEENARLGASDGRVTEILLITEALQDAGLEAGPRAAQPVAKRPAAPVLGEYMTAKVIEAEGRVRYLKRNKTADDGQWRYLRTQDEAGRVAVRREYKTEAGFLAAFIREARAGHDILIAE